VASALPEGPGTKPREEELHQDCQWYRPLKEESHEGIHFSGDPDTHHEEGTEQIEEIEHQVYRNEGDYNPISTNTQDDKITN